MTTTARVRVLIVDDHPGVVKAVSRLLAFDYDIVGGLNSGKELLAAVHTLRPDVVVLDVNLPDIDGISACRQITEPNPEVKIIMFTADARPEVRRRSLEAGACALVGKNEPAERLLAAIQDIVGGG